MEKPTVDGRAIWPEQTGIEGSAPRRDAEKKFRQNPRRCRTLTAMGQRHTVAASGNGGQQWQAAQYAAMACSNGIP